MNKKQIDLTQGEIQILNSRVIQKEAGMEVMKKVIEFYMSDLIDIRNIEKGNMGLQTSARQLAYDTLESIFSVVYENVQPTNKEVGASQQWK